MMAICPLSTLPRPFRAREAHKSRIVMPVLRDENHGLKFVSSEGPCILRQKEEGHSRLQADAGGDSAQNAGPIWSGEASRLTMLTFIPRIALQRS
jgi:hypothetical protein